MTYHQQNDKEKNDIFFMLLCPCRYVASVNQALQNFGICRQRFQNSFQKINIDLSERRKNKMILRTEQSRRQVKN